MVPSARERLVYVRKALLPRFILWRMVTPLAMTPFRQQRQGERRQCGRQQQRRNGRNRGFQRGYPCG